MENDRLDPVDRRLLRLLEQDARLSFADLAEQVGLSKTPCWKRVRALESAGYIRAYRALIDRQAIGLSLQAFVQVSVAFDKHEAFEAAARGHDSIVSCHATTGSADYLLVVMVANMDALDELLRKQLGRMPGVRSFVTSIAMQEIKIGSLLTTAAEVAQARRRAGA
jgi:Lrp/AsnC family leucine-responsive transcriptional regulator